jgi:hypothetical protein
MAINQSDVGKTVTFLYGCKGYGEGVLLSINGSKARIKATKLRETASCNWRRCNQEVTSLVDYVCVKTPGIEG